MPEFVTWKEMFDRLEKFEIRMGRLEKIVYVLAAAVLSPKFNGPDPSHLVGTIIGLF